uniref:Transmembrane protein 238 n=1 Tax=Esox lucius TaxID=8010 RepID=A0A3P8YQ93_ESOLU
TKYIKAVIAAKGSVALTKYYYAPSVIFRCLYGMMDLRCIGGCVPLFFLGIAFDVVGFIILFIGIFANLQINGRFYGDFLIYSGSIIIFFSLAWWIMWYVGNIHVSEDSFGTSLLKKKDTFVQLARKLSERLSRKFAHGDASSKYAEDYDNKLPTHSPVHIASRITWGKSVGYHNDGYDFSLETSKEKEKETTVAEHGSTDSR